MMKDADLKRNASGYYDETCYKGITAPPKAGEIWTTADGKKCWLILRNNGTVCSTLLLGKEEKENSIKVMGKVPMYTDPVMVGYTFTVYIATFVKSIPAANLAEVKKAVGEALGITAATENPLDDKNQLKADVNALTERLVSLQFENNELKHDNADLRSENKKITFDLDAKILADKMVHDSIADMEQEICKLKVYKDMYTDLIDKLVSVRGGTVND